MRSAYYQIAMTLKTGREAALHHDRNAAIQAFDKCIRELKEFPPERTRDVLLAHSYLNKYQTLAFEGRESKRAVESLHWGVSYARSTKDPVARAIAEECLMGSYEA
jgi:hypothetical protein